MRIALASASIAIIFLLTACNPQTIQQDQTNNNEVPPKANPTDGKTNTHSVQNYSINNFAIKNLAKSDIDHVADIAAHDIKAHLEKLTAKLYKRNPREIKKRPGASIDIRIKQLFSQSHNYQFGELNKRVGEDAINLAFDQDYQGDRVFAFMVGISSMLHASYNYRREFYMLDSLDQQKLYNSARNLEIIYWRLTHRTGDDGKLLLLSNSLPNEVTNLSYERLFGKMIAIQDMTAKVTASKTDRTISKVVISVAQTVLLPVGI